MKSKPGTYALILRSSRSTNVQIGCWGRLNTKPGYYIYVGSAFGPGGVQARVLRHCRKTKSKHWHIDYLGERLNPIFAWYSYNPVNLEHQWAKVLSEMVEMSPLKGFGCTDCKCFAHLFVSDTIPTMDRFTSAIGRSVETWIYQADC